MWQKLKALVDDRIIRHFRESHAPVQELSIATMVGLFWALTPLIGVQMILTTFTWFFLRSIRINSNLVVALAWVWLTNPVTMPFFYYAFYITGYFFFQLLNLPINAINFDLFAHTLDQANQMNMIDGLMHWLRFMVHDLGWPMLVGSSIIGIPAALIGMPITTRLVNRYRTRHAAHMGLTLKEWEDRYVHKRVDPEKRTATRQDASKSDPEGHHPEGSGKRERVPIQKAS